jgi:formate hydrogenlyase subunit 4
MVRTMAVLPAWSANLLANVAQLTFLLLFAPLAEGILAKLEERIQGKQGPSIFQVYLDIAKLLRKDEVVSEEASWLFRFAPVVGFAMPLFVVLLVPALTTFPLTFAFMGDMVAAGFFLALAGYFGALAAMDTGNPYGPIGASRSRMVGFLVEPVFMMVFFSVSYVANSTIPYIVNQQWVARGWASFLDPTHVLVMVAFVLLILADEARIPVDSPSGHVEIAMISHSKGLEYSGRGAALMKWGSAMKLMLLTLIFVNVLVAPYGLADHVSPGALALAAVWVFLKVIAFLIVLAGIEMSLAKLRLFRISEFVGTAFVICLFAMALRLVTG